MANTCSSCHYKDLSIDSATCSACSDVTFSGWTPRTAASLSPAAGIGDIHSDAKGSGARYNTGKPPLELVPLRLMAAFYHRAEHLDPGVGQYITALDALGRWQERDGNIGAVIDLLGNAWHECAQVFAYGKKKYSKRGDCTCTASDALRKTNFTSTFTSTKAPAPENFYEGCVSGATTKTSRLETLATEIDRQPIIANGLSCRQTESEPGPQKTNAAPCVGSMLVTRRTSATPGYACLTGSLKSSMTPSSPPAALYAEAATECTLTTATPKGMSEPLSAIPATLALDLSKGLTIGLAAHSAICDVHLTPGNTGAWNWSKGMAWSIPMACAARHLEAIILGEVNDPESGLPHRGHVKCNLVMLATYEDTFPEGDDRPAAGLLAPVAA